MRRSTIWIAIMSAHAVLLLLVMFTNYFQDTPLEAFGITLLAVPYLLKQIGLPVLQNNGLGDGGWATPNLLGWIISVCVWLAFYWLVASVAARLTSAWRRSR